MKAEPRHALLGLSGCGKTTLLNIISGLVIPSHGRLLFDRQVERSGAVAVHVAPEIVWRDTVRRA